MTWNHTIGSSEAAPFSEEVTDYAEEITHFLTEDFDDYLLEIILEPGWSLFSNAGILVSEIVLISRKSSTSLHRWIYTDVGKFSGFIKTLGESNKYPIYTDKQGDTEEVALAGPTCDSADIMYENYKYEVPLTLAIGDLLNWFLTGTYTTTYSAIKINGFPPLKQYVIE